MQKQILPQETYFSQEWFDRECRELFDQSWVYACLESAVPNPGDFQTFRFMGRSLFVVRDENGQLNAFHNLCRHRGCEVLEGSGNTKRTIVCPYHRWGYQLDGALRGVTDEKECFGSVEKRDLGLFPAAVGVYRGMVFVNPNPKPTDSFTDWVANMDDHAWPHGFDDDSMIYAGEVVYEMQCNWKVFYENAIDGYHLGYLHDQTLGPVYPSKNEWELVGRNHVWYSTERDGERKSSSLLTTKHADAAGAIRLHGDEDANYPGVIMLFPMTILGPNPWGFFVSVLEPIGPEQTNMRTWTWAPEGSHPRLMDPNSEEPIRVSELDVHPLETGNFQIEDMWIVEKVQRNLHSPHYQVGPLASGSGAETPLVEFQQQVLDFVPIDR